MPAIEKKLKYLTRTLSIIGLMCISVGAKSQFFTQDSLALVDFFTQANGPNWTNQSNWLSPAPVPSWFGVIPIGNRVDQLLLPGNGLSGSVPGSINQLTQIKTIDLKNNQIQEIDTIKPLALDFLQTLDLRFNKLDFGDFEKSIPAINMVPNFLTFPQDSVGQPTISTRSIHDTKTFSVSVDGSMNQYQWYKNGTSIPGANSSSYTISSLSDSDEGQYLCKTWSSLPIFSGDTLYSHNQHLNIGFCTDSEGGLIFCNQISIQWEPGTTPIQKELIRSEFSAIVIDSCMCEYELWSLSDTVTLEGAEGEVAKAESKTRVKDADVNNVIQVSPTQSIVGTPPIDFNIQGSPNSANEVLIAILDSGIDYTHSALRDYIRTNPGETPPGDNDGNCAVDDILGYNYIYDNADPFDDNGHGTHVAGIAVQGIPIGQVALLNLKIADSLGIGSIFHAICAIEYSIQKQADIINLSWGYNGVENSTLKNVIAKSAESCETVVVAAAGNEYVDNDQVAHYPSEYGLNNIVAVSALNSAGTHLADYSNYGQTKVDIAAPGTDIMSTVPYNSMQIRSGTSMATGSISNAWAKLKYQNTSATYKGLKHCILSTAITNLSWADSLLSSGRLNTMGAINCINTSPFATNCEMVYDLRGFLEGPFNVDMNHMDDSLRARGLIPLAQPYTSAPWNYSGSESITSSMLMSGGDDAIVDWVLIRRISVEDGIAITKDTAAILRKNGSIVGTDGALLSLSSIGQTTFALIHRNHLALLTANEIEEGEQPVQIYFSDPRLEKEGSAPIKTINGFDVMISGDANMDGQINAVDQNLHWRIQNGGIPNYSNGADFNLDGQANAVDLNIYFKINNSLVSFCEACY